VRDAEHTTVLDIDKDIWARYEPLIYYVPDDIGLLELREKIAELPDGSVVRFRAGTYHIDWPETDPAWNPYLTIPCDKNLTIEGEGIDRTVLYLATMGKPRNYVFYLPGRRVDHVPVGPQATTVIRDMTVYGSPDVARNHVIEVHVGRTGVRVERCRLIGRGGIPVLIMDDPVWCAVLDCRLEGSHDNGQIQILRTGAHRPPELMPDWWKWGTGIANVCVGTDMGRPVGTTEMGVFLSACCYSLIEDCLIEEAGTSWGVRIDTFDSPSHHNVVRRCRIYDNRDYGVGYTIRRGTTPPYDNLVDDTYLCGQTHPVYDPWGRNKTRDLHVCVRV